MLKLLEINEIDTDGLTAIEWNGTNVNTGAQGGVIRLLEKTFGRHLQWFVCLLHANELSLRHFVQKLYSGTQGSNAFSWEVLKGSIQL